MRVQTDIHWEVTDTHGETNYAWLRRGVVVAKPGEDYSDIAVVRRVKKSCGWNGVRCFVERLSDSIQLMPVGTYMLCNITFHEHGRAS